MKAFSAKLIKEILANLTNNYGDNFDYYRYGKDRKDNSDSNFAKIIINRLLQTSKLLATHIKNMIKYHYNFSLLYNSLEDEKSRDLLIKLLAYILMGYKKVKLPLNKPAYWEKLKEVERLAEKDEVIPIDFNNWELNRISLQKFGYPIFLYGFVPITPYTTFILEHYAGGPNKKIKAGKGDIVIDAGSCWGHTALYFSHKVGRRGKVFSFEPSPSNLEIMENNLALNPRLSQNIQVVKTPLWIESNRSVRVIDRGPGSKIEVVNGKATGNQLKTISIDDFVNLIGLKKVDFIKMDIEGSELKALRGATDTILKYKPKLAISVYHSLDDFVNIPQVIKELNEDYELYLGHYSILDQETVLFAI